MAVIRPPHKLKATKTATFPERIIFFDTETKQIKIDKKTIEQRLKLGVYCFWQRAGNKTSAHEDYTDFFTIDEFWDKALSHVTENRRMVFIAHNLDFDFLTTHGLTELKKRDYHAQHMIISGNVDIWSFVQYQYPPDSAMWKTHVRRYKKNPRVVKTLLFLDFMNYFKTSLAALGKNVGVKKMKINFDTCTMKELLIYCRNDVLIMVKAWEKWYNFLSTHNLGVWGKTLPAQAFNAYRHRFMPHDIFIHSNIPALELERRSYHGGRTECFQIGKYTQGPYYLLDVNSLYPSVMIDNKYPTGLISGATSGSLGDLEYHIDDVAIIADVLIESERIAFPYRYKGRLVFPTGRFWTTLTTPELKEALKHREIKEVGLIAFYDQHNIFHDYVDFFYTHRAHYKKVKDKPYDYITKLFLTSLYGKFGQMIEEFTPIGDDEKHELGFWREYDIEDHKWLRFRKVGGKIETFVGREESYNSFPAIAAHVTGYARMVMHRLIKRVPRGCLFYTDTDSLIVNQRGYEVLKSFCHKTKLGALHLEKQSAVIEINNVKDYVFARKRKIKGVRKNAVKIRDNVFEQQQQVSLKAVIKDGKPDRCIWKEVTKHLSGIYTKGKVLPNGLVIPFHFWEE